MNQNSDGVELEREKLLQECQRLLNQIANHRLANKLLIAVKSTLEMTLGYKAKRGKR